MEPSTDGRYRVLGRPHDDGELLLLDVESFDPVYVRVPGAGDEEGDPAVDDAGDARTDDEDDARADDDGRHRDRADEGDDLAATVANLRAGYVVDVRLAWADGTPRFAAVEVVDRTLFEFCPSVTGIFEAARETWAATHRAGEAMNSRVTRDVDGEPNGALYVFAEQAGARDLFEEFRTGVRPLDPLVDRVDAASDDDGPREVFVMRPADEPFVLVYVAFEKGGLLADTVRDTYDCPRPTEAEPADAAGANAPAAAAAPASDGEETGAASAGGSTAVEDGSTGAGRTTSDGEDTSEEGGASEEDTSADGRADETRETDEEHDPWAGPGDDDPWRDGRDE